MRLLFRLINRQHKNSFKNFYPKYLNMNCPHCNGFVTIEETEFFTVKICEECLQFTEIKDRTSCCKTPVLFPSRLILSNGAYHVRNQCNNCGFVSSQSLGGFKSEDKDNLPIVNVNARESRDKIKNYSYQTAYKKISDLKEQKRLSQIKEYRNDYLQSSTWREKRLLVLQRDNWICQSCRTAKATDVHHLNYDHIRNEPLFELVSVCRRCHEAIEEMKTGVSTIKIIH